MATLDSLPYYDRDLDVVPNLRQRVEREIELELKATLPPAHSASDPSNVYHPFLSEFPDLLASSSTASTEISHPLLKTSLPRLLNRSDPEYRAKGEKEKSLDVERFNIPYPGDYTDVQEWEKALSNAKSQLEHQRLRLLNLNLIGQYGANHWKLNNFLIEKEISKLDKVIDSYKVEIDNVNRRRKTNQTDVGDRLTDLAQKWQNLISTNISVEITNINLKYEVEALRQEAAVLKQKLDSA